MSDSVIADVLHNGQPVAPGESGDVVLTGLHSFAMPLIRYGPGDVAVKGTGTCGCGFPGSTFARVQGRATEYIRIVASVRQIVGAGTAVALRLVSEMAPEPTGKLHLVVNRMGTGADSVEGPDAPTETST